MKREIFDIILMILVSSLLKVQARDRIFVCGVVNEYSAEYHAMTLAINDSSAFSNTSIILKRINVTGNINLLNQAIEFLKQNTVTLIDGSRTKTSACALAIVAGIPLIRLHGNNQAFEQCGTRIQMSAPYRSCAHAALDVIKTFQWETIVLVFDENRFPEAGYFYTISLSTKLTLNIIQLPNKGESKEDQKASVLSAAEKIANLDPEVILLYTTKEKTELLLTQPKPCKQSRNSTWILQGEVSGGLSSLSSNVVLALRLSYIDSAASEELKKEVEKYGSHTNDKHLAALAYDSVQVIKEVFNKEPCLSINGSIISSEDRDLIWSCLKKVNRNGITGPIQFDENGARKGVELQILNLRNNTFKEIGTWNATKHAVFYENVRQNIDNKTSGGSAEGRKLKVVVVLDEPFVMTKKNADGTVTYEGYCIDLLKELAKILHFTYEIYLSPDGLYGLETDNGTWNGVIAELDNKRADVAVGALTITESREKVTDFSVPFMYYTDDMLLKKTSSNSGKVDYLQFMDPFHNNVWFATLASLVIISVAVFVINYFSPYGYKAENGKGTSEEFSFFNSAWFALACMLQQGADNQPRSLSGRILAGCYWFCILIWVSTYTANLAAFFTVKNAQLPINNLEDIVKSSFKVGIIESGSTEEFFRESQYETHRKIWQIIQAGNGLIKNTQEAVQWVRGTKEAVFIYDGPAVRYVANQPPCDLIAVPGLSTAKGLGFAFQANDPNVKDFSLAILKLHENGFLEGQKREWWEMKNMCSKEEETTLSRKRISLNSMLGVYVVMGVGMLLAFFTLIGEIFWNRREKKKLGNKTRRPNICSAQVRPQNE